MNATRDTDQMPIEFAHRAAAGIDVMLLWERQSGRLWVAVDDASTGESFELAASGGRQALELFYHPFAYAAARGITSAAQTHRGIEPESAESGRRPSSARS